MPVNKIRTVAAAAVLAAVGAAPLGAQYYGNFGKNKVQYQTFDFRIIQTEHFDVYYYPAERAAALDAARMAERSYARLSRVLHHEFQGRKPIILYASQSDFQQTNVTDVFEGLEGSTDFFKHRMVLPFTGSYHDFEHVLTHEMVHQFQYDVYSRGRIGAGVQTLINVNPPLWFMEGMAEYLSRGPIDPFTAMTLRDAALNGHLPSIEQMTYDPNIFPYHYGHALMAYIGEKWGDEAIGEILQASTTSGIEGAIRRATGLSLQELSDDWRDAVRTTFLPQVGDHYRAQRIAQPLLTEKRSGGTLHIAPALSPDGRRIAFFGERNGFFVDLWLADAESGRVLRRLVRSTLSSNYETLRFINSVGAFSPDGRLFAIAAKNGPRDDLVILDVDKNREVRRIKVALNGILTPTWSPDGKQIAFTGFDGGLSDLFVVNADGSDLRRLTNDKEADLEPAWSPDGKTIAFTTDRGPQTDFQTLRFGNYRVALYHLDTGSIELLGHMSAGRNANPVWSPDGKSLAFVSDRTGYSNIFLYDFGDGQVYQLTDMFSGVAGIAELSPALSWARQADRLAFSYYEDGEYNVYAVDNPRSLRRQPIADGPPPPPISLLAVTHRDSTPAVAASPVTPSEQPREAASVYRSASGFRASAAQPQAAESTTAPAPVSVKTLLDSATLALPDTTEFTLKPYHTRYTPDYVARPTVGYERDNFGRGFFGGTAISLSDILGNHTMVFSGAVNGRLSEAQVLAVYVNQAHRSNWATGFSQTPYYFYGLQSFNLDSTRTGTVTTSLQRYVVRDLFGEAYYPLSRFDRFEIGAHAVGISQATLELQDVYFGGQYDHTNISDISGPTISYVQPSLAFVHDKSLFGYVGPFAGARDRFELSPSFGTWRYNQGLVDMRRYFFARPFTLALRGMFLGRVGRDGDRFPMYLGSTELIRGYTSGSIFNNECAKDSVPSGGYTGCATLDQLIGSRIAIANVELRFPLARNFVLGFLPVGFPPIEGALFYDAGIAWQSGDTLKWNRAQGENPAFVRAPLKSYGASIRANLLGWVILRFDYTKPVDRPGKHPYWTVSLGPTF